MKRSLVVMKGYVRVRDRAAFPSVKDADPAMLRASRPKYYCSSAFVVDRLQRLERGPAAGLLKAHYQKEQ